MKKQREVKEFENVKEIIYNSAKEYSNNVAFIEKKQIKLYRIRKCKRFFRKNERG